MTEPQEYKLEAIRSDVADSTPEQPDPQTEGQRELLEVESKKSTFERMTPSAHDQYTNQRMHDRNERRIEQQEQQLIDLRQQIQDLYAEIKRLTKAAIASSAELARVRENKSWKAYTTAFCGLLAAVGGVLMSVYDKSSNANAVFHVSESNLFFVGTTLVLLSALSMFFISFKN